MSAGANDGLEIGLFPEINGNVVLATTTTTSTSTGTVATSQPLSAVPALNSRPGAAAKLFLDFGGEAAMDWGGYAVPTTPAYDIDGDTNAFSDAEMTNIQQIWARVAEKFSPFNINITTVDPGALTDRVAAKIVIGGDGGWLGSAGGVAYVGGFTNYASNIGFAFSKNLGNGYAKYVAEATAHEMGHLLGLDHQAAYSGTTKTAEYNAGTSGVAPVMGNSYSAERGVWSYGTSASSSTSMQDDLSIISDTTNGFGYRVDDHGNAASSATALAVAGSSVSGAGVIERMTDSDFFSFTTAGGTASFRADPAAYGAMLDLKMELRNSAGALVTSANTTALGESLTATLAGGSYFLTISSKGNYGDLGQYSLSGTVPPAATVSLNAATGLTATAVSPTQVNLAWTDNSTGEAGYRVQRSSDGGATWTSFVVPADARSYADTTASSGSSYLYRVQAYTGTASAPYSSNANAMTVTAAPSGLLATAGSSSQVNLSWSDVAGESGYRVERSLDGVNNWSVVGTTGVNITSFQDAGLSASTTYHYRVVGTNAGGSSAASGTATATTQAVSLIPTAPANLTARFVTSTTLQLNWSDRSNNESAFRIEYSTNGTNWYLLAQKGSNVTSAEFGIYSSAPFYFRVYAYNSYGDSARSNVAMAQRPAASTVPTFSTTPVKTGESALAKAVGKAKYSFLTGTSDLLGR